MSPPALALPPPPMASTSTSRNSSCTKSVQLPDAGFHTLKMVRGAGIFISHLHAGEAREILGRMEAMIFINVKFHVKPEYADTFLDEINWYTEACNAEPGCLEFKW